MTASDRSHYELLAENEELRFRLEEAEETLRAIGSGEVDALVVSGPEGDRVFTLKGAEQPYRVLVETMSEGAATLAADGTILYCNNRLAAMLQAPLENFIGTKLATYVSPADHALFAARLEKCQQEGDKDEIVMMTRAGKYLPVLISCCTLDLSGSRGLSVVVTDLTQQKRSEEIMASERLARSIIEQAGEAIIVCDDNGRIIRASISAHQLCEDNLLLKPFDELFQLRMGENRLFSVLPLLHGQNFEKVEVEFRRRDSRKYHLLLNANPLKSGQDKIIGCVVTLADISERRQSEEELRAAHQKLSDILEQMSDGFASFDRDWRYTRINSAAAKAFNIAPDQLLGKAIWEMWPAAYDLPLGVNFRRSVQENIPIQFETYYPAPLERWFECRCHPTAEGLATFFSDITERKHAEEVLKSAHDHLEQRVAVRTRELDLSIQSLQDEIMERARAEKSLRMETAERLLALEALRERDQMLIQQSRQAAMGEMIGNIAHQWRQPLNILGLTVQQLQLYYDLDHFDRAFLVESVGKSMELIHHMSQTIDDFRHFFKPDKEKIEFKVQDSIARTMSLLEGTFQAPSISVEIIAKDDPVMSGYPNEFSQVFLNILVNAKDALIERNIGRPEITVTISSEDGCAAVTVADNAGGIPEEIVGKIFEPYFTTKGPQGGTGVGLFMSKIIIEKNMGGRLTVRNTAEGAEFRIEVCR